MTTLVPRVFGDLADWLETDYTRRTGMIKVEDLVTDTEYVVRAELPGMDPAKDIQISLANGLLTIHAERKEEIHNHHRTEFRYGAFQRTVRLPVNADETKIVAKYTNGILEITTPLKPEPAAKQITITKA